MSLLVKKLGLNNADLNNKLTILGEIYENKQVLFGKINEHVNITHDQRIKKWKEIAEKLKTWGIFNRDWKYLRDTTWQNWRKRTLEKRDNVIHLGSDGWKRCKYDESDELILKILGKETSSVDPSEYLDLSDSQIIVPKVELQEMPSENFPASFTTDSQTPPPRKKSKSSPDSDDSGGCHMPMNKERMEIELALSKERLEIAKRERYKLDLELLKLERELNIRPSSFTMPLHLQNKMLPLNMVDYQGNDQDDTDRYSDGSENNE